MRPSSNRGPVLGHALLSLTCRLRGVDTLQVLEQIEQAPFRSPEEVREKQFSDLLALLSHAESRVPYYRRLFSTLGIKSEDIRNWDDFARLPILTKDIIRENQRDLIREDVPLEKLTPHFSGGSTGVPLKFFRSSDYMVASDAGTYRNLMQCGWRPGEMIAFFWGGNDKLYAMTRAEFELRQFARRTYQFDPFYSGEAEMADWVQRFRRVRPRVILGYASTIARFAGFLDHQAKTIGRIKGVFTTAEKLYQPQREVIERVFHCKVFDCYGSSEVQNIAAECPAGKMHINADFVVMEQDRTKGEGRLDNAPRPFLLTSLRNWSMPFIRYRNEDGGYLSDETCSCDNHFPLMRLEIARTSDNFIFPDGRVVHGEFFTHLMYGSDGIVTFQFHQTAPDKIILSVVAGSGDSKSREDKIRESIRQIQAICPGHLIQVEVREVAEIPLSAAGKYRFTRSDVSATGTTVAGETVPASRA
ncbi:MAG: phenylacetate--CoA ligase family protein [Terriglobales bacterium]